MAEDFHYTKDVRKLHERYEQFHEAAPALAQKWWEFDKAVFEPGALDSKTKELMAITAAHITGCPWCINFHTRRAKRAGATEPEVAEAVYVAMALSAGAAYAHSSIAMEPYE
jgi:AhpD family alkylhydroperoxidase